MCRAWEETYEAGSHGPITPWQFFDLQLFRQRVHDVAQRYEACRLHSSPSYLAWYVEAGVGGCFALRVPLNKPLSCCKLYNAVLAVTIQGSVFSHGGSTDNGKKLPAVRDELPVLARWRHPVLYNSHVELLGGASCNQNARKRLCDVSMAHERLLRSVNWEARES